MPLAERKPPRVGRPASSHAVLLPRRPRTRDVARATALLLTRGPSHLLGKQSAVMNLIYGYKTTTALWPCGGLCLEKVCHSDVNILPSAVFGPVHQNVAPRLGRSLLSMIAMSCCIGMCLRSFSALDPSLPGTNLWDSWNRISTGQQPLLPPKQEHHITSRALTVTCPRIGFCILHMACLTSVFLLFNVAWVLCACNDRMELWYWW